MDEPNEIGDWQKICQLGSGSFGIVTLWRNKQTDEYFALKKCRLRMLSSLSARQKERWKQEVATMKKIKNDYVVSFKDLPEGLLRELNKYNPTKLPLLSMEYCSKGNLRKYLRELENRRGLKDTTVRCILSDICEAVEYLHSLDITHRDIKPENIVMQHFDERPEKIMYKIIDLGYAKELGTLDSFVGTLPYVAPEIFEHNKYTKTVDYWSFGMTAYEVITGELPFLPNAEPPKRFQHIREKSEDDICIFISKNGKVIFSKEILRKLRISSCFKKYIEDWLRPVLQFDGVKRGTYKNKPVDVIKQIKEILLKKIVKVLFVYDLTTYSYEIIESSTFKDLKNLLEPKGFLSDDLFILTENQKDVYNDEDKIIESVENVDHTTEFYIFHRTFYMDAKKSKSFPKVLDKLYASRNDFSIQETLEMSYELMYFLWEEEMTVELLIKAIHNQITFTKYMLDVFLSKKLFDKIRTDLTALITKIECYEAMNKDLLNDHFDDKYRFLNTYRKLLRQTKELVENVNGMSEKFLQFCNKKEELETMMNEVNINLKEDEFKNFFRQSISTCNRIITTQFKNFTQQISSSDLVNDQPPAYKELFNILNKWLKMWRTQVVTNSPIEKFISSINFQRKLKRHYTWCMALDKEIFRISTELQENQRFIHQKFVNASILNEKSLVSIVFPNVSGEMSTKTLVEENMELRYAIQEKMDETVLTLQNIQREVLKLSNGVGWTV